MALPALLIGFFFSTIYGLGFHLLVGGNAWRLLLYLVLGWIGFWAGHIAAEFFGLTIASLGTLHLGAATVGSALTLGLGYWLSLVKPEKDEGDRLKRFPDRR
jgi:hypothetical protein